LIFGSGRFTRGDVTQYRTMFNLEESDGADILSAIAVLADA